MPFLDLPDVQLFYTDEGPSDRAPLLFVHGYGCDSHDWSWQLPHFVADHRVIAVDLRGHGSSSAPETGYTPFDFAHDLTGLLDYLGLRRVVVIGHSLGAVTGSVLAVEHPESIIGLVTIDPAYLLPDTLAVAMAPALAAIDTMAPAPIIRQILESESAPHLPQALRTWHLRRVDGTPDHVLRQAFRAQVTGLALQSHSADYLIGRSCPVLSFHNDPERARLESDLFPRPPSRSIVYEGAGHWLHQERPEDFNTATSEWLADIAFAGTASGGKSPKALMQSN